MIFSAKRDEEEIVSIHYETVNISRACHVDSILRPFQSVLQILEVLVGLEVRIFFDHHHELR
jgi:hypothetical protein